MKRKIKICFIGTAIYPLFNPSIKAVYGGSEIQLFFLGKELAKEENIEVSFLVGDFGQNLLEDYESIKIYKSLNPKANDNLFVKAKQASVYWEFFKKINADIYFTSTKNSLIGLIGLFCKIHHKKHIHRTASKAEVDKNYLSYGFLDKIFLWGMKNSNQVITQTLRHQEMLKKNFNISSLVLKNSFVITQPINRLSDKDYILWVGRYDYMKKPEKFLMLSTFFPKHNFLIICPQPKSEQFSQKWMNLKEEAQKLTNVRFLNKIPLSEIQIYFNKAKVFVNTSDFEGFPNTFIQAGIGRTPILSLNVNPDDFITNWNCGYFSYNAFEKMKQQLAILLHNSQDWLEKSNQIFKYVENNHNIKKNVNILKKKILNSL